MSATLTCLFSLYDETTIEYLSHLNDASIGGTSKACIRVDSTGSKANSLFLRIPPPQRGNPMLTGNSAAMITTMAARKAEILAQETVYVKWAFDAPRVDALRHEAQIYTNQLRHLQGTIIPKLIGHYVSSNPNEVFSISIYEHCFPTKPSNNFEYHRQFLISTSAIHAAGVIHNQLGRDYVANSRQNVDHHVLFDNKGYARIVDFTQATFHGHMCSGASGRFAGVGSAERTTCRELSFLESVIGERMRELRRASNAAHTMEMGQQQQRLCDQETMPRIHLYSRPQTPYYQRK